MFSSKFLNLRMLYLHIIAVFSNENQSFINSIDSRTKIQLCESIFMSKESIIITVIV